MTSNEEILRALAEVRKETQEGRDAVMSRIGSLESVSKHLAAEVTSVRVVAERSERIANEAKRQASNSSSEIQSTFAAVRLHVEDAMRPLQENDRIQNRELNLIKRTLDEQTDQAKATDKSNGVRITVLGGVLIALVPIVQQLLSYLLK